MVLVICQFIVNMERLPLLFYQEQMLRNSFKAFSFPVEYLSHHLQGVIDPCTTQDELLNAIIKGGSLAYNAVIEVLKKHPDKWLYMALVNHNIKEKFRWVYIWSWTGETLNRGSVLYDNEEECRAIALNFTPNFDTLCSPGAPYDILSIESMCPCYTSMNPGDLAPKVKCECFINWKPRDTVILVNNKVILLPELMDQEIM